MARSRGRESPLIVKKCNAKKKDTVAKKRQYHRQQYQESQLILAVDAVRREGFTLGKASRQFGVPKSTLHKKIKEHVPLISKMGPEPYLTREGEERVKKWILDKAKLGFPMHPNSVKDSVQKILNDCKAETPFADNRPGDKWLALFLRRHPEVRKRHSESISKSRAAVTEERLREWFAGVTAYLADEKSVDVLEDGRRILNLDETGVQLCPKSGVILGPRNFKNLYEIAGGNEKENITVLCTFSANGDVLPPMIVYPYKRLPDHICKSVPEGWSIGISDSGWMVARTFYQYVRDVMYPWLVENDVTFPVILFMDGHKSHASLELCEFCSEKKIILYSLYPNATHILQPCDVSIFKPLKNEWQKITREMKQRSSKPVTRANFAPVFKQAFDRGVSSDTIRNGFRTCGLFPFNAEAVDYTKCINTRRNDMMQTEDCSISEQDFKCAKRVLEHIVGPEEIKKLKRARKLSKKVPRADAVEDRLLNVWKSIVENCGIASQSSASSYSQTWNLGSSQQREVVDSSQTNCPPIYTEDFGTIGPEPPCVDVNWSISNSQIRYDDIDLGTLDIIFEDGTIVTNHLSGVVEDQLSGEISSLTLVEDTETRKNSIVGSNESEDLVNDVGMVSLAETLLSSSNEPKVTPHVREDRLLQKSELYDLHLLWPQRNDNATKTRSANKEEPIYAITSNAWRLREEEKAAAKMEKQNQIITKREAMKTKKEEQAKLKAIKAIEKEEKAKERAEKQEGKKKEKTVKKKVNVAIKSEKAPSRTIITRSRK